MKKCPKYAAKRMTFTHGFSMLRDVVSQTWNRENYIKYFCLINGQELVKLVNLQLIEKMRILLKSSVYNQCFTDYSESKTPYMRIPRIPFETRIFRIRHQPQTRVARVPKFKPVLKNLRWIPRIFSVPPDLLEKNIGQTWQFAIIGTRKSQPSTN